MLAHLRRAATVVAVVLVGLALVVLDPSGPPAMALQAPPPPVTYPGSVLSTGNLSSPELYNKALTANPSGYTTSTGATSLGGKAGLSAAGAAGTVVGGLMIGTSIGSDVASVIGLPTSGSFICDVGTVFGSTCAVAAVPGYAADSDISVTSPGFTNGAVLPAVFTGSGGATATGTVGLTVDAGSYRSTGVVTVGSETGGGVGGSVVLEASLNERLYEVNLLTGVVRSGGAAGLSMTNPAGGVAAAVRTFTPAVGYGLDHLEFNVSGAAQQTLWYPVGHVSRPPDVDPHPQRWWRTTWECSVGAGGSALSAAFGESSVEWPGFPAASCDAGAVTRVLIEQITEGLTTTQVMYDWTADPAYVEWARGDCVGGGCTLLLRRIDSVTGSRLSCFDNPSLCVSWFSDPDKLDNYECTYGGNIVDLSECNVYSPTFDPAQTGQGINYADPQTGTAPSTGTGTGPGGDPQDDSCPPPFSWSSLVNPYYYYKGTVCALEEVFIPQNELHTAKVRNAVDQSVLGAANSALGSIGGAFEGLGSHSCGVIVDTHPASMQGNGVVVDTCGWPWSSMGGVRTAVGVGFLLGAVLIGARSVLRTIRVEVDTSGSPS